MRHLLPDAFWHDWTQQDIEKQKYYLSNYCCRTPRGNLKFEKQYFFAYTLLAATDKENRQRQFFKVMRISRKIENDYGHTLPNSFSFCNQLHGHRGVIVATVEGAVSTCKDDKEEGMVMDFHFLKELMVEHIHEKLDHGFAVWKDDHEDLDFIMKRNSRVVVTDEPPTAECLAKWAFNQLCRHVPEGVTLTRLRWYETPNNWADYEEKDVTS